jgi:hypothetical protein
MVAFGPAIPNRTRFTAMAVDTVAKLQPKACSIGKSKIVEAERAPPNANNTIKVRDAITQP